jgi:peptide deformylase
MSIVQEGNTVLRATAAAVTASEFNTPELDQNISDMRTALAGEDDGLAIAAPQIGVSKRIFLVSGKLFSDDPEQPGAELVFINPEIIKTSRKKKWLEEGCLSVRWQYGEVERAERVSVSAYDATGKKFIYNGAGLLAQVFQHEIDHLNGILFIDKAKNLHELPPADSE